MSDLLSFYELKNIIDDFAEDHDITNGNKEWLYNVLNDSIAILNHINVKLKKYRFKDKAQTRLKQTLDSLVLLNEIESEIFGVKDNERLEECKSFFENMAIDYMKLLEINTEKDGADLKGLDKKFFKSLKGKSFNLEPHNNMENVENRQRGFLAKYKPISSKDVLYLTLKSFDMIIKDEEKSDTLTKELFDDTRDWKIAKSKYDYISVNGHSLFIDGAEYPGQTKGKKYFESDLHYWSN